MVVSPSTVSAKCESSGSCVVSSSCCRSLRQTDRQQRLAGQHGLSSAGGRAAAAARLGGLISFSLSFFLLRDTVMAWSHHATGDNEDVYVEGFNRAR